jgi:hypothetical protein
MAAPVSSSNSRSRYEEKVRRSGFPSRNPDLTRARRQWLSAILDRAIELGPEARTTCLENVCGADARLRAEAEELPAAVDAPDDILARVGCARSVESSGGLDASTNTVDGCRWRDTHVVARLAA